MKLNHIYHGDCLEVLKTFPDECVNCVVTSPPYWGLRDYGVDGQLGLEETPEIYVSKMVEIFSEVKRVLKDDGTLWVNLGDSYASGPNRDGEDKTRKSTLMGGKKTQNNSYRCFCKSIPSKNLIGMPWRIAFALQAEYRWLDLFNFRIDGEPIWMSPDFKAFWKSEPGWYLRSDIIWSKPNPMPESVTDRPTKSHEYVFLLSKNQKYYFDQEAVKENSVDPESFRGMGWRDLRQCDKTGDKKLKQNFNKLTGKIFEKRNIRSVWHTPTQSFPEAHFATFPEKLIEPCIKAGCPVGGVVLDPFMGSGTTAVVAHKLDRQWIGIELNQEYIDIANRRIEKATQQLRMEL